MSFWRQQVLSFNPSVLCPSQAWRSLSTFSVRGSHASPLATLGSAEERKTSEHEWQRQSLYCTADLLLTLVVFFLQPVRLTTCSRLNPAQVVRRIKRWRPETFLLENVKGLANKRNRKFLEKLLKRLLNSSSIVSHSWYPWFSNMPSFKSEAENQRLLRCSMEGPRNWFVPNDDVNCFWSPSFMIPLMNSLPISQVMDTWEYGGLPQRRSRLWIVGTTVHATKRTLAINGLHVHGSRHQ